MFRDLKREGTVRDYIVYGSVAAMVHARPFYTKDIDIGVVVSSDLEYIQIRRRLSNFGVVEGQHVEINGTLAAVFPSDISPIIDDAVEGAFRNRVENVYAKVATPEHLVLEALRAARRGDRLRALQLDMVANRSKLKELFERLDRDGELQARYQAITGQAP